MYIIDRTTGNMKFNGADVPRDDRSQLYRNYVQFLRDGGTVTYEDSPYVPEPSVEERLAECLDKLPPGPGGNGNNANRSK
jgi:hypothetical protein